MQLNCFVLQVFLIVCGANLTVSAINESKVKSYSVLRRNGSVDYFTVKFKDGNNCAQDGEVWRWCQSLSAYYKSAWKNRTSCSCTCDSARKSFLPPLQTCINTISADKFGGCQSCDGDQSLLKTPVDLQRNGSKPTCISSGNYESCNLQGEFFDYDDFQPRWKNMSDSNIFSLKKAGPGGKFSIHWEHNTDGKLSGRIIRLNFTCSKKSGNAPEMTGCMLIKAQGTVTYSSGSSRSASSLTQSTYPAVPTSIRSITRSSALVSPPQLSMSKPLPSSPISSSSTLLSPTSSPSSSSVFAVSTTKLRSASTGILTLSTSTPSQTRSLHTRSAFPTSQPDLSSLRTEYQSSLPFYSEGASSHLVSTGALTTIFSSSYSIKPSKSSLAPGGSSSSDVIDGPGNKKARTSGNDSGTVIGAAVGGAAVFGIFIIVIIVFCKRRKSGEEKDKSTKVQVKNPVYESSDIPLSSASENSVTTSMEKDSQPTYQDLVTDNGKISGAAIYSNPDDNDYDNYSAYQSLDKKVPGSPVYQSLTKGLLDTGKPTPKSNPGVTGPPSERPKVTEEPVYNVLEQPDTEQATMPVKVNRPQDHDSQGGTQDPVYNVLDDTEENYEVPDVGDSLYNVLEGPESEQDPQEPLYNVVESSDAEKTSHQGAQDSHGLSNEPLYNVVEGPGSDGPNKNGLGYNAPNGSTSQDAHDNPAYEESPYFGPNKNGVSSDSLKGSSSPDAYGNPSYEGSLDFGPNKNGVGFNAPNGSSPPDAHDNPAYEQNLDFDVPYASVHRPGSQRESVYEPLKG